MANKEIQDGIINDKTNNLSSSKDFYSLDLKTKTKNNIDKNIKTESKTKTLLQAESEHKLENELQSKSGHKLENELQTESEHTLENELQTKSERKLENELQTESKTMLEKASRIESKDKSIACMNMNLAHNTQLIDKTHKVGEGVEAPDYQEQIRQLFNQICHSHQEILEWTEGQKHKLGQLWWIYNQDLDVFKIAFEKIEHSDFLSGRIKSWKASLDWILIPMHFADILGDKYRNFRKQEKHPVETREKETSEDRWDFDEIERLEAMRIERRLNEMHLK